MKQRPVGISELLVQVGGPEREALWEYAVAKGRGVEIFELSEPEVLDDTARLGKTVNWYRERRADFPGPVSFHGPYQNLRPGAADGKIRAASRERILQGLELAEELGAGQVVFHSDFDLNPTPAYVAAWTARAAAFWRELAAGRGVQSLAGERVRTSPATLARSRGGHRPAASRDLF